MKCLENFKDKKCKSTLIHMKMNILNRYTLHGIFLKLVVFPNSNQFTEYKKILKCKAKKPTFFSYVTRIDREKTFFDHSLLIFNF